MKILLAVGAVLIAVLAVAMPASAPDRVDELVAVLQDIRNAAAA